MNGEILGAMRRKPRKGEFRTNIHVGAKAFKHDLTDSELEICGAIKDKLVEDGLFFVGVDVIGNKMVEINCLSPGGIPRINRLNKAKLEVNVIDFIEQKVAEMKRNEKREIKFLRAIL